MWKWIKIPKGIALLAFLLPWMTVSCEGQPFARAAGWQLMLGRFTPVITAARNVSSTPASSNELNIWLILALATILIGLAIACLKYSKQMSLAVLVTSIMALLLIWVGTMVKYSNTELLKDVPKSGGGGPAMDPAALQGVIQINWEWGFWLTVVALIAAGAMAFLAYSGKDAALGGSSAPAVLDRPPEPPAA